MGKREIDRLFRRFKEGIPLIDGNMEYFIVKWEIPNETPDKIVMTLEAKPIIKPSFV